MKKILSITRCAVLSAFMGSCAMKESNIATSHDGRCSGTKYCTACSNCTKCQHCNAGGVCGICSSQSFETQAKRRAQKKKWTATDTLQNQKNK